MASPYKRRKPSLIKNLWVYRRVVLAAMILGLMLWFIVINSQEVTVYFPFRLGQITSTAGVVILLGAVAGSLVTGLILTIVLTVRRYRGAGGSDDPATLPEDRPPTDYAAKTGEGFADAPWSKG